MAILKKRIAAATQREVAEQLGVSRAFLNDVVHGRRNMTEGLATAMGFTRIVTYKKAS